MKYEKHTWTVPGYMNKGEITRVGYKFGYFGFYRGQVGKWFVNHLPTGAGMSDMDATTREKALQNCRAVSKIEIIDWSTGDIGKMFKACHGAGRSPREVVNAALNERLT